MKLRSFFILIPASVFIASGLAWADDRPATVQPPSQKAAVDQRDAAIGKLKEENARLRERLRALIEQMTLLNENVMNCMDDLKECEDKSAGAEGTGTAPVKPEGGAESAPAKE